MLWAVRSWLTNTTSCPFVRLNSSTLNCRSFWVTVTGAAARTPAASSTAAVTQSSFVLFIVLSPKKLGRKKRGRKTWQVSLRQKGKDGRRVHARQCVQECQKVGLLAGREAERMYLG